MGAESEGQVGLVHVGRTVAESGLEPFQRAPTLMAGELPGSQGMVEVWAPDDTLVRKQARQGLAATALYFGGPLVFAVALSLFTSGTVSTGAFFAFFLGWLLLWSVAAVNFAMKGSAVAANWRRRYLTTDDAGIGVTLATGTRYLKWEEIAMAVRTRPSGIVLYPERGRVVRINLAGYTPEAQAACLERITLNAHLEQSRRWFQVDGPHFLREGYEVSWVTGGIRRSPDSLPGGASRALPRAK